MADLNVIYKIAADISGLQSGVDRAAKATEGLEATVNRLGAALTAAFSVTAVVKLTSDVITFASTLSDLSSQTAISTSDLQKFSLAFGASGVSIESVANSATKLAKALVQGDDSTVGALNKLGLSVAQLKTLNPADQFTQVADAIGKIENPTERAWAAMQVFGKGGAELLKGLDGHLAETTKHFEEMGLIVDEQTITAIDDFGDQLGMLGKAFIGFAAKALAPLIPLLVELANALLPIGQFLGELFTIITKGLLAALYSLALAVDRFLGTIATAATKIPLLGKHLGFAADAAEWLAADAAKTEKQLFALFDTTDKGTNTTKKATGALLDLGKATKDHTTALKDNNDASKVVAAAWAELLKQLQAIEGTKVEFKTLALADALKEIGTSGAAPAMKDLASFSLRAATDVDELRGSITDLERAGRFGSAAIAEMNKHVAALPKGIDPATTAMAKFRKEQEQAKPETKDWSDDLNKLAGAFRQLAQVSGGSLATVTRAIAETFSTMNLASKSAETFHEGLVSLDKGSVVEGIANITQGIVGLAGAMIQATSSASALQNTLQGALTAGEFGAKAAKSMGSSPLVGMLWGSVYGGVAAALISAISSRNQEREARDSVSKMIQSFGQLHGGITQLRADAEEAGTTLTALFNATTVDAYTKAVDDLNAAFEFQNGAMQTLDDTVKKYGFTLEELGPALQKQTLDKQAQTLYQDFKVLTGAGIDVHTVLEKMGDSINDLVHDARKTGAEVPAAMRPILQQMVDMGTLVDENGNAFGSLEDAGLSFSETMTQGFNRLIAVVDKLTQAIARGLGLAIDNLPDDKTITISAQPDFGTIHAATGGRVTTTGLQPWVPSGPDIVPAWLEPGEIVLNPSQQAAYSDQQRLGGRATSTTINFAITTVDASDFQDVVERKIFPAMVNQLRRGKGVTQMNDVLGRG